MIDTAVDTYHPIFKNRKIIVRNFVAPGFRQPTAHGTSVISEIVGNAEGYKGLLPGATVLSASVFFEHKGQRRITTTENVSRSLEWMIANGVRVINMSFTGPYSSVLDVLIRQAAADGTIIVAAAGNQGPGAPPAYPAAYDGAVAVTAVANNKRIYRLANRGKHIMFAAPGVEIYHATPGNKYGYSSGTSMASPFVAALLAAQLGEEDSAQELLANLAYSAEDLGPAGRDPIYGFGLIKP